MILQPKDIYPLSLFELVIFREARGEVFSSKIAMAWTVRNRVKNPGWWGQDFESVILMPWQYSSFNHNDPNAVKMPHSVDPAFQDAQKIALDLYGDTPTFADLSCGADSYFDNSLDNNPPAWAGIAKHVADVGNFHFFKTR